MKKEIKPADRLGAVSEYYFSRKLKEIAALRAQGVDIVSLGIGGPDLPPPAAAVDAAVACLERTDSHSYQMTVGLPQLRAAFAGWYARYYGVEGLDRDRQILPLIGSKEGVLNIAMAFLNPGDGVLVPNPGYPTYTSASRLVQAEIFPYELTEETGWMPDFEALETSAARPHQTDVGQLSSHAHGHAREDGALRTSCGLRTPPRHCHCQ